MDHVRAAAGLPSPAPTPHPTRLAYDDVYEALRAAILPRRRSSFSLADIATRSAWVSSVRDGQGHLLVGGAISGALHAQRTRGAQSGDVERCPSYSPGAAVTPPTWSL